MKKRRLLGTLFVLALVLGLLPGMSLTAYADDYFDSINHTTTVITFDDKPWYLIGYDESYGYVTLLSKDCVGASPYNSSGDYVEYASSTVKTAVDDWYASNISENAKAAVNGDMFLLTFEQAYLIRRHSAALLECQPADDMSDSAWWLCTKGQHDDDAMAVTGYNGEIESRGYDVVTTRGVRPALNLNLSCVIFSSESNTFSLKPTKNVSIIPGDNMTKTADSGAASQADLTGAMTPVVYTANEGYYFSERYKVASVNGISVTRNSYTQITVSGTPTGDAEITLEAPWAKVKRNAPTKAGAVDCTTTANNDGKLTGVSVVMEYKRSDSAEWVTGTGGVITGLAPGTYYVRNKATNTTLASDNQELTIRAVPVANDFTYAALPLPDLIYDGNAKAATVEAAPGMGAVTVKYYSDAECNTEVSPTDAGTYYVGVTVEEGTGYSAVSTVLHDASWMFEISKQAAPTPLNDDQKPTANTGLAFTGNEQELVAAPTSALAGYTVQYSLDGENWSTELLKGTNAGDYTVKVRYVGDGNHEDFNGTDITVTIGRGAAPTLTDDQKPTAKTGLTYTGSDQALVTAPIEIPVGYIGVKYALGTATEATQPYTTSIPAKTDAGIYYIWYKVVADKNYNDSKPANVKTTIEKDSIAKAKVTLSKTSYTYDGKAKEPAVKSVALDGKTLKAGADYSVTYRNSKKLGTATAVVTGTGKYKDSAKATYKIKLGKAKVSAAGNTGKKTMKVSWKKVAGAKKYQMQYRQAGGKWKSATVAGTSKTVTGLKSGKLYQFRVRAVAGEQKGAWSNAEKRWLKGVKGIQATSKKAGTVTATWEADSEADAGYTVVVRYERGGAVAAKVSVGSGKTKATVKGLDKGKKLWVEVRPMRTSDGLTYAGVLHGRWAKDKSGKSAKTQSVEAQRAQSSGLTAASI